MRNLKKILALVLALVMSLSLMATASAADFADVSDDNPYKVAIDVLEGLKVFQGYQEDGTFRPEASLTRAQAAALVYRIATGDAEDQYVANYTDMAQSKFTDLDGYNWARGYINYCQNAEIVKGKNAANTIFDPGATVSGYQLMAMVLRTMGYGKNGEFEGNGWELQTSTIAERIGILKGITSGDYGSPAPRQMVAQILFNALRTSTVDYTALNGYQPNGETLGHKQFGLESVTGVVMANQWAALDDDVVMAVDSTRMNVTKIDSVGATSKVGDVITLDEGTDLDAVGMTYTAYVAGKTSNKQTLTLEPDGNNVGFNEGKAINTNVSNQGYKALKDLGVALDDKTEYYIDYDQNWTEDAVSDYLIRYEVTIKTINDAATNKYITEDQKNEWLNFLKKNAAINTEGTVYLRTIRPGEAITEIDQAIMKEIFYSADRTWVDSANPAWGNLGYIRGEVYVGTTSLKDYSDTMSWVAFKDEYFNDSKTYKKFESAENGESVRIIDNDGDGVAEYALKITYTMDKVVGTYKDALLLNTQALANFSTEKNTLVVPEGLAQDDVVVYSLIDKQLHIRKAESVEDSIKTKNWKNVTVTTSSDATYGQSGISNKTNMDESIQYMNENTQYVMYQDLFGFIRAYKLAQGTQYALLTEMYTTGSWNANYVQNGQVIAEVKVADADVTEYAVSNGQATPFRSTYAWSSRWNRYGGSDMNMLQPAIAHLGTEYQGFKGATTPSSLTDTANMYMFKDGGWAGRVVWEMAAKDGSYGVFDYGTETDAYAYNLTGPKTVNHSSSFTNVAAYTSTGDKSVALNTASKLLKGQNGEQLYYMGKSNIGVNPEKTTYSEWQAKNPTLSASDFQDLIEGTNKYGNNSSYTKFYPVWKTDYVQLTKQDVKSNTIHFNVDGNYSNNYNSFAGTATLGNTPYVNATVDTEFYIVMPGTSASAVQYVKGVANLPTIKAGEIRAAYAVATNTAASSADRDYWVADVIVIETKSLSNSYDSISLAYYSPFETSGSTYYANTLNNYWRTYQPDSAARAMIDVIPAVTNNSSAYTAWGNIPWGDAGYGFYKLYNSKSVGNDTVSAGSLERITADWNSYGIYAGYVQAVNGFQTTGYLNVTTDETGSGNSNAIWVGYNGNDVPVYRITRDFSNKVGYAQEIYLNVIDSMTDVKVGDPIIWVYEKGTDKLSYIVDLATRYTNGKADFTVPSWLFNKADVDQPAGSSYWVDNRVVANPTSEFGKILKSQRAPIADNEFKIEFKVEGLPAGTVVNALNGIQYSVTTGSTRAIQANGFVVTGYANPTVKSVTNGTAAFTGYGAADFLNVAPVAGLAAGSTITVVLEYVGATKTVELAAGSLATASVEMFDQSNALVGTLAVGAGTNATVGSTYSLKVTLATPLPTNGELDIVIKEKISGTEIAHTIVSPLDQTTRTVATFSFVMPNDDVTVEIIDKNPAVVVTTALANAAVLTYSVNGGASAPVVAGTISAKANDSLVFVSDDPFFATVDGGSYVNCTAAGVDGKYTYTYTVGKQAVTITFYEAERVTITNNSTTELTYVAPNVATGKVAVNETENIFVPYNLANMTVSNDVTTSIALTGTYMLGAGVATAMNGDGSNSLIVGVAITDATAIVVNNYTAP